MVRAARPAVVAVIPLAALALALAPSRARAQAAEPPGAGEAAASVVDDEVPFPRPSQPPVDGPTRKRWYGWQMLAADAAIVSTCFGLMQGLDASQDSSRFGLMMVALVTTPVVVHGLNGDGSRAWSSIGARLLPFIGMVASIMIYPPELGIDDTGGGRGIVVAEWVGGLGYLGYYVWELGFHTTHVDNPPEPPLWSVGVAPTSDGGTVFGLGGSF